MGGKLQATLKVLADAKAQAIQKTGKDACIAFYSGGFDSRAVLHLAVNTFETVVPVAMYFLPGLRCFEEAIDDARSRYGLKILQYPHWALADQLAAVPPLYRPAMSPVARAQIPKWSLRDVYDLAIGDTGIQVILDGAKASDGLWRRRVLKAVRYEQVYHPIETWLRVDVRSYLAANKIPGPIQRPGKAGGVGLHQLTLLWIYDNFPDDFEKICEVFPFAYSVVARRSFSLGTPSPLVFPLAA